MGQSFPRDGKPLISINAPLQLIYVPKCLVTHPQIEITEITVVLTVKNFEDVVKRAPTFWALSILVDVYPLPKTTRTEDASTAGNFDG